MSKIITNISDFNLQSYLDYDQSHPFGNFPTETNIQLARCPQCGVLVTDSSLEIHLKTHTKLLNENKVQVNYRFPTASPFHLPFHCAYEEKWNYVASHLEE